MSGGIPACVECLSGSLHWLSCYIDCSLFGYLSCLTGCLNLPCSGLFVCPCRQFLWMFKWFNWLQTDCIADYTYLLLLLLLLCIDGISKCLESLVGSLHYLGLWTVCYDVDFLSWCLTTWVVVQIVQLATCCLHVLFRCSESPIGCLDSRSEFLYTEYVYTYPNCFSEAI